MSKIFLEKFSKKLKKTREEKGFTQDILACDSGISRSTISMVEIGKRDLTLSKLEMIAAALGVEPYELLKFDEQP